jgi:hypothetical protein
VSIKPQSIAASAKLPASPRPPVKALGLFPPFIAIALQIA